MMFGFLRIFTGWQGYAALGLVCFLAGAGSTWRIMTWREQAHEKQALVKTVQLVERRSKITFDVGMNFEAVRLKDSQATEQRQQEVAQHVTPQIDSDYPVPCGFVRLFNDATRGPLPDPATCPDGAPSTVALSTVGHTEIENDGQYDQLADQLKALQDWVRQQQNTH